jgi:dihydroorotase
MTTITLTRPDDWHLHLRDGAEMRSVLPHSTRRFGRALVMPNLRPPITTTEHAEAYRERILSAVPEGASFEPLLSLYLTDRTDAAEIARAKRSGIVHAVKLYPAGATTHSAAGVTDIGRCRGALEAMREHDLPLLVHGEVTDPEVDIFDRETVFIERVLEPLIHELPGLRVVLEHVTTRRGIELVSAAPRNLAATITAHHLLLNRNHMLVGGIHPHHYCLPVLKREADRAALVEAATGGDSRFFLGTDSAPHARAAKQSASGSAGVFTAHAALELYAEVFDRVGRLDRLEAFASFHGADFYGLPRNPGTVTLVKSKQQVPAELPFGDASLVPMRAGLELEWSLELSEPDPAARRS